MDSRIRVEVIKLPTTKRVVSAFVGDSVRRVLAEAFEGENFSKYSITINGDAATLDTRVNDGDSIVLASQIKGN